MPFEMCDKLSQIVQRNVLTTWAFPYFQDVFQLGGEIAIRLPRTEQRKQGEPVMSSLSDRLKPGNGDANMDSAHGPESLRVRVRHAVRQVESEIIREALEQHRWNRRRVAEALKISYRSLMYKMKTCNLRDTGPASEGPEN